DILGRARGTDDKTRGSERGKHENADPAAEITAVDRDEELCCRRAVAAERRACLSFRRKAAPGEHAGREQHKPGNEASENRGRRDEQQNRADGAADEAYGGERMKRQRSCACNELPSGPGGS